jgi:signal transduction histidine kinase
MVPLESSPFFNTLPLDVRQHLLDAARIEPFARGSSIFREGDAGDGFYAIIDGEVAISAMVSATERRVFSKLAAGDFFGEMAVLDGNPRSASATAETNTTLAFVPRATMETLFRASPELALRFAQVIAERLRNFNQQHLREVLQVERLAVVGRFASAIVHDLKNPLMIISMASMLGYRGNASTEERDQAHERISMQVDRVTNLLNDVLDFVRGNRIQPTLQKADYAAFIRHLVTNLEKDAELKSATLVCANPPPAIPVAIDASRLSRAFCNLAYNAMDAMPDGGTILLRFEVSPDSIITEIEDTGPGLPPEIIGRLFEPFATHGKEHGTGLGLSIVKRIIEEHGGLITARNQPGGGAIFSFTLPRVDRAGDAPKL